MATEICASLLQFLTDAGAVLNGGKVYVYDVTTTTPQSLYTDTSLSVSTANPIVLDSAGRSSVGMVYKATGSYKIVVKTSADVTLWSRDNIDGRIPIGSGALAIANGGTSATTASAALSALGGVTSAQLAATDATVASLAGTLSAVDKTHVATGTTAQRPSSPIEGDIRRNTTIPQFEGYDTGWRKIITEVDAASDTGSGAIELAVQSEQETGTDVVRAVTPGRQQFHPSACKCFGFTTGGGTPVVHANSYNVTSITDTATGRLTVTIGTDFSSANYIAVACAAESTTNGRCTLTRSKAAGSVEIATINLSNALVDPDTGWDWALFGDQ